MAPAILRGPSAEPSYVAYLSNVDDLQAATSFLSQQLQRCEALVCHAMDTVRDDFAALLEESRWESEGRRGDWWGPRGRSRRLHHISSMHACMHS